MRNAMAATITPVAKAPKAVSTIGAIIVMGGTLSLLLQPRLPLFPARI
jgi:hypothetical protein